MRQVLLVVLSDPVLGVMWPMSGYTVHVRLCALSVVQVTLGDVITAVVWVVLCVPVLYVVWSGCFQVRLCCIG